MSQTETSIWTVVLGLILGLIATMLAFGQALGLGFTLYVAILIAVLLLYSRVEKVRPVRRNLALLAPVLFFAAMFTLRAEETLTLLNLAAMISAALLLVYFFASDNIAQQSLFAYPIKAMVSGIAVWFQPISELLHARKWLSSRHASWHSLAPFARGAAITVPVVAVFVILFSSADEVFARLVSRLLNTFLPRLTDDLAGQIVFFTIFSWTAIGGLAFALLDRKAKRAPNPATDTSAPQPEPPAAPIFSLGFTETMMLLGGVVIVFASFVVIQFVYLFGGERNIANFSYADYVHRGFAELVVVAVLTLGLALTLNVVALRRTRRDTNLFRGLSTVLVLLTGVILVSAFQRLRLYELAYGFTTLRLAIYVFIVWLGVLFAGFTLSLYWTPVAINVFSLTALIAVFGFVATLDVLNPDAFVTWQNLSKGDIDPLYLSTLSEEAVPTLIKLVDADEPGLRSIVRHTLYLHQQSLRQYRDKNDFREFNLGRTNALIALDSVQDRLVGEQYRAGSPTYSLDKLQAFLRKGMTTRQVVRQLGAPLWSYASSRDFYSRRGEDNFVVVYTLDDSQRIELDFDTKNGLESMCLMGKTGGCQALPLAQ
jgi:hypothetical protein